MNLESTVNLLSDVREDRDPSGAGFSSFTPLAALRPICLFPFSSVSLSTILFVVSWSPTEKLRFIREAPVLLSPFAENMEVSSFFRFSSTEMLRFKGGGFSSFAPRLARGSCTLAPAMVLKNRNFILNTIQTT